MLQVKRAKQRTAWLSMQTGNRRSLLVALLSILALLVLARGQAQPPEKTKWWPSEWGAGDQRGAANRMTPQKPVAPQGSDGIAGQSRCRALVLSSFFRHSGII